MGRRSGVFGALVGVTTLVLMAGAGRASATFHEMKIRAIFEGVSSHTGFVELQMYAPGQNHTAGKHLTYYDSTGASFPSPPLTDVANGDDQRTILVADNADPNTPDLVWPTLHANIVSDSAGGAICYENIDCVAWGTVSGLLPSPVGTHISGIASNRVLARRITANCPTALDNADDTNDSAADFDSVTGFPVRNNSVAPTETVCPPTPSSTSQTTAKKCKKKKHRSAGVAKKKKCKKKKR